MEYLEGFPSLKLTYKRRVGAIRDLLSGLFDSDWGNSSSRPTRLRSCGNQRYRGLRLCLKQRRSTMRLLRREVRFCTSASSSSVWGSPKRRPRLSFKTTQRASSGVTTSLVDESEPSTSTSGSTSPTRLFRMARCCSSASPWSPNSLISSPRASTTSSGRYALKAPSAGRSNLLQGPSTSRGGGSQKAQEIARALKLSHVCP